MPMINRFPFFFVLMLVALYGYGQPTISFKHLTVDEGLVSNHINAIIKDEQGFLWCGTSTGLSRFDGYRFKSYSHRPHDAHALLDNNVQDLFIGFDQHLWVRTVKGNCVYDSERDIFHRNVDSILYAHKFPHGDVHKIIMANQMAYVLYENGELAYLSAHEKNNSAKVCDYALQGKPTDISYDPERNVLLLVSDKGELVALDGDRLHERQRAIFSFERLVEHAVFRLFVDDQSGMWVYAKNFPLGALYYESLDSDALLFRCKGGQYVVNNDNISNIQQVGSTIWMATDHGGINVFDLTNPHVDYVVHEPYNRASLPYNSTTALYKDTDGVVWVGTYKGGVSYYHPDLNFFSLYQHQHGDRNSLPFNDINCFVEDRDGNVWIGTNGGGLVRFDPRRHVFESYRNSPTDEFSLGGNVVVSLFIDSDEQLWIGTYHGGLNKFENGRFKRFLHTSSNAESINDNSIWSLLQDSQQRFWIGMLSGGIDLFDQYSSRFNRFKSIYPSTFSSSYNAKIVEDSRGNIWFGTSNGLVQLSVDNSVKVFDEHNDRYPLTNNVVSDMLEDKRGNIWVATQTGINILSADTMLYLSTRQGLIDNVVVGLVMDDRGDIWATTPKGISRITFNLPKKRYRIRNYDKSDGLQSSNFNERAIYKLRDGRLLFGGSEGFNIYAPSPKVPASTDLGNAAVVDFKIQVPNMVNEDLESYAHRWLTAWHDTRRIEIPYHIQTFHILLSDFDFVQQHRPKLEYKLQGLSDNWIDVEQMDITVANLGAGNYTLLIRRMDHNGTYSSPVSLMEITKLAPWWGTNWAYFIYILAIGGLLLFFRKVEKMRARTRFNLIQAEEKARHAKEMEELRTRFFTNVSHEFRTPISLIISPVQKLQTTERDLGKKKYLDIIERNASSLLNLVNQLLDFNSIESNAYTLKKTYGDVFALIRRVGEQFESIALAKRIHYVVEVPAIGVEAYMDFEKLERVVLNLLSNAFKFTPMGGQIYLTCVEPYENEIRLEISDTGVGVPKEMQSRVFDRYFQVQGRWNVGEKGSGLGLSIVKEFVQLMAGTIQFASEEGVGTTVGVRLPLERSSPTVYGGLNDQLENNGKGSMKLRNDPERGIKREHLLRVMVIEDHADFAFYLQDNLGQYFQVSMCKTTEEALKQLYQYNPDIIVSDLHLPGRSGIEFCKELRANERTKHIPFILITAVGSAEKEIEALKNGASDFICKPFNFDVFLSKIKAFVEQQGAMEKRYKRQIDVNVGKKDFVDADERFVWEITAIIEDHLQNENFSVEVLASQMNMTRVGLYKKILSITGFTPIEFIRNIRLNKALDLLKNTQKTVSEISYEVGFGTPKQFSKYFKSFYGEIPSTYRK